MRSWERASNLPSWPGKSAKRVFALDDPAIHALFVSAPDGTWMAGTSPAMTSVRSYLTS
jgi:hypothetical protein